MQIFERPGMRCTKRPRSFLWIFRWLGYHDFETTLVRPWAFGKWTVYVRCKLCGAEDSTFGVTDGELLQAGIEIPADRKV